MLLCRTILTLLFACTGSGDDFLKVKSVVLVKHRGMKILIRAVGAKQMEADVVFLRNIKKRSPAETLKSKGFSMVFFNLRNRLAEREHHLSPAERL